MPASSAPTAVSPTGTVRSGGAPTVPGLPLTAFSGATRSTVTGYEPPYIASWLALPGAPALTEAQDMWADAEISKFLAEWADGDFDAGDTGPRPELNIAPQPTAVGDTAIGVRMMRYEFGGASGANSLHTIWYSRPDEKALTTSALFTEGGFLQLRDAVVATLGSDENMHQNSVEALAAQEAEQLGATFDSVNFRPDGSLVVELDQYAIAAGSEGLVEVIFTSESSAAWLSPFGEAAQAAAASPMPEDASPEPTPASSPSRAAPKRPDCSATPCVAITFDDGPGAHTGKLLDILKEAEVPATFFVLGPNVEMYPDLMQRMIQEGHQVGNHTWSHRQLTQLSDDEIRAEHSKTADAVEAAAGSRPHTMRPPYGAQDETVRKALSGEGGDPLILWDVDTLDWRTRDAASTIRSVKEDSQPGSIVLMHDIHASTVEAVPGVVEALEAKGYTLVTVDQLLATESPAPGTVHTHGPRVS